MWSLAYSLVEMTEGRLPWRGDSPYVDFNKKDFFCSHKLPPAFEGFDDHLGSLCFEDPPDYDMLSAMFLEAMERIGVGDMDPFDWEHDEVATASSRDSGVSTRFTTCDSSHPFSCVS